jgi:hypothetical protein
VRERSNRRRENDGSAGPAGAVVAAGQRLWTKAAQRPVDSMAIACAVAASFVIVVNAVFLQSGAHPAPFFANPAELPPPTDIRPAAPLAPAQKLPEAVSARPAGGSRTPQMAPLRRNDPIADLIGSGATSSVGGRSRVMAVQRALSEYGYGQIKPSGVFDEPTSAAIAKFEGDRKLPVTGRLSDRLLSELAAMTGHPIE